MSASSSSDNSVSKPSSATQLGSTSKSGLISKKETQSTTTIRAEILMPPPPPRTTSTTAVVPSNHPIRSTTTFIPANSVQTQTHQDNPRVNANETGKNVDKIRKSTDHPGVFVLVDETECSLNVVSTACKHCSKTIFVEIKFANTLKFLCCWCGEEGRIPVIQKIIQELYSGQILTEKLPHEIQTCSQSNLRSGSRLFGVEIREIPVQRHYAPPAQMLPQPPQQPVQNFNPGHDPRYYYDNNMMPANHAYGPPHYYCHSYPHHVNCAHVHQQPMHPIPPVQQVNQQMDQVQQQIQQQIQRARQALKPIQQRLEAQQPVPSAEKRQVPEAVDSLQQAVRDFVKIFHDAQRNRHIPSVPAHLFAPNPEPFKALPKKKFVCIIPSIITDELLEENKNKIRYDKVLKITETMVPVKTLTTGENKAPAKKRQHEEISPEREGGEISEPENKKQKKESSTTSPKPKQTVVSAFVHQKHLTDFHEKYYSIMLCQTNNCKNLRKIGEKHDIHRYCEECLDKRIK